jgi:hypothetical protein
MELSKKKDLILRELYNSRDDGKMYSMTAIAESSGISLNLTELSSIAHNLEDDGLYQSGLWR